MGDIVNLNQVRKAKARDGERRQAEENRAKFGRSKGEKAVIERLATRAERTLDAHRRERPTADDDK